MELAFAGLHQLCAPLLDRLAHLPDPQQDALHRAFGLTSGGTGVSWSPWRRSACCRRRPRSDRCSAWSTTRSGWTASALALAFVARRLEAESVAVVFATREPSRELRGLPELAIGGLAHGDARALLDSAIHERLDERVRDRIVAETRQPPGAAGAAPRFDRRRVGRRVRDSRRPASGGPHRANLPPAVSFAPAFIAAATAHGGGAARRCHTLWRAVERFGLEPDAVAAAEGSGLIEVGARVRFRHPLVRSAIYWSASPQDRSECMAP